MKLLILTITNVFLLQYLIFPIIVAGLVAYFTFKYNVAKLKKEIVESIEKIKYEAILKAHIRCFSLLAYLTETENELSIFTWVKDKNTGVINYFVDGNNHKLFIKQLRIIFYDEGNGIYLSKEVLDSLFKCRSILYGLSLSTKDKTETKTSVKNDNMPKEIFDLCVKMNLAIRKAIELDERILNLKNRS
jgi:hypothetical protein